MADDKGKSFSLPTGLAAAVALVVAAFAAVGVAGELLTRAVRNSPEWMATFVTVAFAIVAVATVAQMRRRDQRAARWAVVLLTLVVGAAVFFGAFTVSDREKPSIAMSASTDNRVTTISVVASASSLRTNEGMQVQVFGLPKIDTTDDRCELEPEDIPVVDVLTSQRSGPDANGDVASSISVEVKEGLYPAICGFVALRDRDTEDPSDDRLVSAYLRLSTPDS